MRFSFTGAAASIALGLAAPGARADMLDFEDLPPMELSAGLTDGARPLTPNYEYHGFNLSAVHTPNDGSFSVNNTWYYARFLEEAQGPPRIHSGEYGLMAGPNVRTNLSSFSFSRSDGGLFAFDGAWFARIYSSLDQPLTLAMQGFVGGTPVYTYLQSIYTATTFVSPPQGIAVDRLEFRTAYPQANSTGGFFMDDFHYTLVPAPSVLAVLGGLGFFRKRGR
jgi:hypothetical protein